MPLKDKLQQLRKTEAGINKNLFLICAGVTIVTMLMMALEFFTRGVFPPARINLFYLGVLIIYSLHKELVRWMGVRKIERQGEYFVYGWVCLAALLYVINFLAKDFFSYSAQGEPLTTIRDITVITLEVLGVFIFTHFLKTLKSFLVRSKKSNLTNA